jgi:choline monooxygenase
MTTSTDRRNDFTYEPDIARAETIPASWYTDAAMLDEERGAIFRRTWQFAAALEDVATNGSYVAVDVVGVPVVLTRDVDGVLRAFYNVCRHRAGTVARGCGHRRTLQCAYHAWTYGLDGALRSTPEFDGVDGFDRAEHGLVGIRVETWGPFAFVNMSDDAPSLAETLGAIPEETASFDFTTMRRVERKEYALEANWKLYVDNYLEGYHVPTAHPGLHRELDYSQYSVETQRWYSRQHAPIRPVDDAAARQYVPRDGDDRAWYYWLFPNFMLNIYQGQLQINVIVPLSHERTVTVFEWYLPSDADDATFERYEQSKRFSEEIQEEDIQLCEEVWRNMKSGAYDRGRFSVKRENGVHHFQGLLCEMLGR